MIVTAPREKAEIDEVAFHIGEKAILAAGAGWLGYALLAQGLQVEIAAPHLVIKLHGPAGPALKNPPPWRWVINLMVA